jgi:transposase
MGSQRVATISEGKGRTIRASMREVDLTPAPGDDKISARVAANSIGPLSKTSSFVQALSSASTKAGIKALIEFAHRIKFGDESVDDLLEEYGVNPKLRRPAGKFIEQAIEKLREDLAASSLATESAIAVEDALPKSVIELLRNYLPRAGAMMADRDQFIEVFRKADDRTIGNTIMKHVISSLIDRIIDAARGDEMSKKAAAAKKKIGEGFVPKLTKEIDRLARKSGVKPSDVPDHISDWAAELDSFLSKYRD